MLDFSDQPYQHFEPRGVGLLAWVMLLVNRFHYLPKAHQITGVEVTGAERLRAATTHNRRLIFLPNHPSHSDPPIWLEASRVAGIKTRVMAAYDVFLRSRFNAWVMQHLGAFSVDREGSDPRAMAHARDTLTTGKRGLTIFPEGNVYLRNDTVTPFHEGAAMIGLRVAKELAKLNQPIYAVPVSIKLTHTTDARDRVYEMLDGLAETLKDDLDIALDRSSPQNRLRQIALAALRRNLRQRGYHLPGHNDPRDLINETARTILNRLEAKINLKARPKDTPIDRFRRARRAIHQVRLDPDRAADHAPARAWADEAMLAFRVLSYSGDYVTSNPTLDRYAETVNKLAEDVYNREVPPAGPRHAYVHINEPIDLTDYLDSFNNKAREATRALTETVEQAVQQGLDHLNKSNPHPGGTIQV